MSTVTERPVILSTTAMIKHVGALHDFAYGPCLQALAQSSNYYARPAAKLLAMKRARNGGTHFTIERSGFIASVREAVAS